MGNEEDARMFRWLISNAKTDPKMDGDHYYHFSFHGNGNSIRLAIQANKRYQEFVEWEKKHRRNPLWE